MNIKNIFFVSLFACPFLLTASNGKNEKIRLFSDAFENKTTDNNKKRKLEQLLIAKNHNENLSVYTIPGDCWNKIAHFLTSHEKLSLRLVSSHFNSLFYQSTERPSICIPLLTLPHFFLNRPNFIQQKKHITEFMEKTRIKKMVTKQIEDFVFPHQMCQHTKNLDFSGTDLSDMQLNKIFSLFPKLQILNLSKCKEFDCGPFLNEITIILNGVNKNHPDFKELSSLLSFNTFPLLERTNKLKEISKTHQKFKKYFSISEWFKLKNLEVLDLSNTKISTQKLQFILKGCPNIKTLRLNGCSKLILGDFDWEAIGSNPNLKTALLENIGIFYGNLTKIQQDSFVNLIQTHIPTLKNTSVEERTELMHKILSKDSEFLYYFQTIDWSHAKSLIDLEISKAFITAPALNQILDNCPKLTTLNLKRCPNLSLETIDWSKAKNLTALCLSHQVITDKDLQKILDNCPNLKSLKLHKSEGFSLEDIDWSKVGKLTTLELSGQLTISNKALQKIGVSCPLLSILLLCEQDASSIEKKEFDWCSGFDWKLFKNLEVLDLGNSDFSSTQRLEKILKECPKLASLHGVLCSIEDDENEIIFEDINGQLLKKITDLELGSSDNSAPINAVGFKHILNNCPLKKFTCNTLLPEGVFDWSSIGNTLEELDLSVAEATVDEITPILRHCIHLKKLILKNCEGEGLGALKWSNLKELEYLDLSSSSLYKADLAIILKNCLSIKTLLLGGDCFNLQFDKNFDWTCAKNLKHLKVSGISNLSATGLLAIPKGCPSLHTLDLGENDLGLDEVYEGGTEVFNELERRLIEIIEKN